MKIGPLRKQVTLRSKGTSADSFGQPIETFTTYDTVWAQIDPASGKEIMNAQQQEGEITHKVKIRYHSSVVITDRVYFGSRILEIVFIRNIQERNHWQELLCKEVI